MKIVDFNEIRGFFPEICGFQNLQLLLKSVVFIEIRNERPLAEDANPYSFLSVYHQ